MIKGKLVRDKIPQLGDPKYAGQEFGTATKEEHWLKLKQKLLEESAEFFRSEETEELADILEVLYAIAEAKNTDKAELERLRKEKFEKRGGFSKRIVLLPKK